MHGAGGDENERGRVERVGDVVDERRDVVLTRELLDVAGDDHAPRGEEGRSARRVDDASDLVVLVGDVVDDERSIFVARELVDEGDDPVREQRRVATPDEMDRHAAASRSAASTSAVRRAPRTSCARGGCDSRA